MSLSINQKYFRLIIDATNEYKQMQQTKKVRRKVGGRIKRGTLPVCLLASLSDQNLCPLARLPCS